MCGCLLHTPSWGRGRNPGMCLDWELNQQPFVSQPVLTQSTELYQPGQETTSHFACSTSHPRPPRAMLTPTQLIHYPHQEALADQPAPLLAQAGRFQSSHS